MLRLLLSKAQANKDFQKPAKPCHIGINWIALTEYSKARCKYLISRTILQNRLNVYALYRKKMDGLNFCDFQRNSKISGFEQYHHYINFRNVFVNVSWLPLLGHWRVWCAFLNTIFFSVNSYCKYAYKWHSHFPLFAVWLGTLRFLSHYLLFPISILEQLISWSCFLSLRLYSQGMPKNWAKVNQYNPIVKEHYFPIWHTVVHRSDLKEESSIIMRTC